MNLHPALSMAGVWLVVLAAYLLLPFQLTQSAGSLEGILGLTLFIQSFIVGALLMGGNGHAVKMRPDMRVDIARTETGLMLAAALASVFFLVDIYGKGPLDLASAYQKRSESASALMHGEESASTIWFQVAFLLYPAGYVFTAAHLLYAERIRPWKTTVFGVLPVALATLSMGGRMPILYLALLALISYRERRKLDPGIGSPGPSGLRGLWKGAVVLLLLLLFYYFAQVFLVRAQTVGGVDEMFLIAQESWGVGFAGPVAETLMRVLGSEATYLIFVFSWYVVQGLIFGEVLIAGYIDFMQWGVYGVDLISAVVRRLDPERLSAGFAALDELGAYGFFPSAWGSLYVDFGYPGALISLGWGCLAGLTYRRVVREARADWLLVGPFVTIGILMSTINSPLGLANGLMIHAWMLAAFLALRCGPTDRPAGADPTGTTAP